MQPSFSSTGFAVRKKLVNIFPFIECLYNVKPFLHLSISVCCEEAVDIVDNYSTNQNESGQIKGMIKRAAVRVKQKVY